MNARGSSSYAFLILSALFVLLLPACQAPTVVTSPQPATPTPVILNPQPTQPAAQPTAQPARQVAEGISLDYAALAQQVSVENVAAVPATPDSMWWAPAPAHRRLTLTGYAVANHERQPQIFIYPVSELASANQNMGKAAADLQTLLAGQPDAALQSGEKLPFLPLDSAVQAVTARAQMLEFKGGRGVRFITQYNSGLVPVNNAQAIYTFQGLTSDGKYYVAAVLPITNPDLAAGSHIDTTELVKSGWKNYLAKVTTMLNEKPASSFTPDLDKLDALIQSIEVK